MEPKITESHGIRLASYIHSSVRVQQKRTYDTVPVWERATVAWGNCPAGINLGYAKQFARAILAAVELARQWDSERAGKPVEV